MTRVCFRVGAALALSMSTLVFSASARADEATRVADDLFNAASAAYQRGDYSAAARAFEEAGRRAPRPETSYNAGIAWEAAGDALRAANAFRAALALGPLPDALAADARERHARLAAQFAELHVVGPPEATIEIRGLFHEHPPLVTYVPPGAYQLELERVGGERERRALTLAAGELSEVHFEAPPVHRPEPRPIRQSPPASPKSVESVSVVGLIVLGSAGLATGAGVALGLRGLSARDRFDRSGHRDADARAEAISMRTAADLSFAGALALGAIGVVLLVKHHAEPPSSAWLSISPAALSFAGNF